MEARLVVVRGKASKREIPLKLPTIIGRSRQAELPVAHPLVSRQHCQIFERDGALVVKDNGSLNGTFVGGQKITEVALRPGDELTVGPLTFRVMYEPAPGVFPGLDATATPADDSTVARPETPESAFVPPSVESAAPADGPNPFDFLESDAAAAAPADIAPPAADEAPAELEPSAVAPPAEPAFDEAPEISPPAAEKPAPENTLQWLQDAPDEEPGQERTIQAAAFINLKAPPPEADAGSVESSEDSSEAPAASDAATSSADASDVADEPAAAKADDEDFFASLGQQVDDAPAAGGGETEFWTAPSVEPEVRDDDSTIIEPEPAADDVVAPVDAGPSPPVSKALASKDKDKPKKKSGGWWPFGKKKADSKPKGKPAPIAQAAVQSEPAGDDEELPPNVPEIAAAAATKEPAAETSPAAAAPAADDDVIIGLPAGKKPDDAAADDLVAGWLSQSEDAAEEPVAAKDDDLNDFLKNFNK